MNDFKYYTRLAAGLGEEVLADIKEERIIKLLAKKLEDMSETGMTDYDSAAREIVNFLNKKMKHGE